MVISWENDCEHSNKSDVLMVIGMENVDREAYGGCNVILGEIFWGVEEFCVVERESDDDGYVVAR